MQIKDLITKDGPEIEALLCDILGSIHTKGPINPREFEYLAYLKLVHPSIFKKHEKKLISLLGLFYKTSPPESLLEEVYSIYADLMKSPRGETFTPVQASVYKNIIENKYFSFSAPTSSGKSFLFRELILNSDTDIIIVVPSRALISEYLSKILDFDLIKDDKSILVLDFIENINKANTSRRIFVITPERGKDLFRAASELNIQLFLFDEAQLSENGIRGMRFDALVERIDRKFPNAKKVFTHPFIKNPEAQLDKHNFSTDSDAKSYEQHTVGKIYLSFKENRFKYFSPFEPNRAINKVAIEEDVVQEIISRGGTLLVYTSKNKIYEQIHIAEFSKYIDLCLPIDNIEAKEIIKEFPFCITCNS